MSAMVQQTVSILKRLDSKSQRAVFVMVKQLERDGGLRYNEETEEAMRESMAIAKGEIEAVPQGVDSLFAELGL